MKIFTKAFLIDTAERALSTFTQTLLALGVAAGLGGVGLETVEWTGILSVSAGAALISVLKNVSVATTKPEPQSAPVPEPVAPEPNFDARHRSSAIG